VPIGSFVGALDDRCSVGQHALTTSASVDNAA
jgi:hypothetical protein